MTIQAASVKNKDRCVTLHFDLPRFQFGGGTSNLPEKAFFFNSPDFKKNPASRGVGVGLSQINVRQLSFLSICLFHRKDRKEKNTNFALLARFAVQNLDFEKALGVGESPIADCKEK
jgi:hypothetical protein